MWVPPVGRAPPGRPPAGSRAGEESAGAGGSSPPLRARLLPPPGAPGRGPASWRRLVVGGRPGRGRACIPSATRLGRRPHAGSRVSLHGGGGAGAGRERSAASASRRGLGGAGRGFRGPLRIGAELRGTSAGRWATTSPPLALPRSSAPPAAPPEAPPPSKLSRRMSRSSCLPLASGSPSAARMIRAFPLICQWLHGTPLPSPPAR